MKRLSPGRGHIAPAPGINLKTGGKSMANKKTKASTQEPEASAPEIARSGPKMVVLKAPQHVCSISGEGDGAEPIEIPESGLVEVPEVRASVLINQCGFTVHRG
jgi:hypothetical protein